MSEFDVGGGGSNDCGGGAKVSVSGSGVLSVVKFVFESVRAIGFESTVCFEFVSEQLTHGLFGFATFTVSFGTDSRMLVGAIFPDGGKTGCIDG